MPANIRYVIQDSNRVRVPGDVGTQSILSAILTTSDLSFKTTKKYKESYGGNPETIVLSEQDVQNISISYIEENGIADHSLKHAREWYKSVSNGVIFELDLDGTDNYENCILTSDSYTESRIGNTLTYSITFKIRWI